MISFWKIYLKWVVSKLFPQKLCNHYKLNPFSVHENFCPDCGKRVVPEWYVLKCKECTTKRMGYHLFGEFLPKDKYCKRCGEASYEVEIKKDIEFYEYSYASCIYKELDTLKDYHSRESTTKVWLDPLEERNKTSLNSRSFNLKLLPATVIS